MPTRRRGSKRPSDGPVKASIYCRISLDSTGLGLGVERQEQACRELCERNGWEVVGIYIDNDVSAFSGRRRPQFEALLASNPEVIVVWHTDRLVRLTADLARVIDLGCDVHAVTAGMMDLSTPTGKLHARMIVNFAEYESEHKGERQRAAGRQRASQGRAWWGSRPFGFELDGSHREAEAEALRAAYAGVLAGASVASLARNLNAAGHVTTFGKPWGPASLRPVLLNARNAGLREYDGEIIGPASWQGIVSEETYRAASRILTDPARGQGGQGPAASALLTGIARCGVCGGDVKQNRRYHWKDKTQSYSIYVCKRNSCASVPTGYTDGRVWREVTRVLREPEFHAAWSTPLPTEEAGDAAVLREEEATLRRRLTDVAEDYAAGILTRAQVQTVTTKTRARLEQIESELAEIGSAYNLSSVLGDVEYVYQQIDSMSPNEQRALVRAVVEQVTLHPRPKGTKNLTRECVVVKLRSAADIRRHQ
ncbi:recombinase family protein [Geodermatophilus sp. SYSU D01186]